MVWGNSMDPPFGKMEDDPKMRKGLFFFAKRAITLAKRVDVGIVVSRRTLQPSFILRKGLKDCFRKRYLLTLS